ncbi:MAG: hypothetical protein AAB597_01940 [Patescibacteria group bacterium]
MAKRQKDPPGGPGEKRTGTTPDRLEKLRKRFGDQFFVVLGYFEGVFKTISERQKRKDAVAKLKKDLKLSGRECMDMQRLAHG